MRSCELLEHLWCFLDGFWRLLVGPGKLFLGFFRWILRIPALVPPLPFVPLVPPLPFVPLVL